MKTALWWIRRDLRLTDNQALATAMERAERVIPVFVLDPNILNSATVGDVRVAFLLGGLHQLDVGLRARGSRLIVRHGEPARELMALARESGAEAVFAEEDCTPYARRRDARVAQALPLHLTGGLTIHPPGTVLKTDGTPYTIFTPYSRAWKAFPLPWGQADRLTGSARKGARAAEGTAILPYPDQLPAVGDLKSLPIPDEPKLPASVPFLPGEVEAQRRLRAFFDPGQTSLTGGGGRPSQPGIYGYAEGRNRLDLDGTSGLSPYLHLGMLSARQAVANALDAIDEAPDSQARQGAELWLSELIWREFYIAILAHFPEVHQQSFRSELRNIAWENDEAAFAAWCEGRTGYPVVDAAMRQLVRTGWMHNRARMIVASFLVKDLLIDWRWGERFFMQHLVDGDVAANNGGWQWTAGTGTDAAPYFRIFNPVLQGVKHDPYGTFVRWWVPELTNVPERYVHAPWKMSTEVQEAAGCVIGQDYPRPMIDHGWARERVLNAYSVAKRVFRAREGSA